MSTKLENKVVIVTGASSGIGEATSILLAQNGAKVAIVARRGDKLKQVQNKIENIIDRENANVNASRKEGGAAISIIGDMSCEKEVHKIVSKTMERWGRIDVLVNNAGIMLLGPISGANTKDWKKMVDINLMGLMYATHTVLPIMQSQKSGHIVNISSVAGRIARSGAGVYNATKFAVGAFSESLRQEVSSSNVRVTIIEPGAVLTELSSHIAHQESKEKLESWINSMTPLNSEDIAESILYAISQPSHVNVNEILIRPTQQSL